MRDFGKKHLERKVVHFGLWAEEIADQLGAEDALHVLQRAAKRTYDEDARCEDVFDAIAYLARFYPTKPLREFKDALDMSDAEQRHYAVRKALVRIKLAVSKGA